MCFSSISCSIYNSSTEPRGCLVQIGHSIVSTQQVQMSVWTSVFPGTHLVTQLVHHVKYDLGPGCHARPRRVSPPSGDGQLAECLIRLAGGPLK